jgi:hypothetical protein
MSTRADQAGVVSKALAAAGIPSERCGKARLAGLLGAERQLYRWILERFAEQGSPGGGEVSAKARELGLDPEATMTVFAREDLIHLDEEREIAVAYPFSGRQTRHRVILTSGHEVAAMCAVDALGIAAMLGTRIEIRSSDPSNGAPIAVRVDSNGSAEWAPTEAVVLAGSVKNGPSYAGCCSVLNFFASRKSAESYLADHGDLRGHAIPIPDAAAVGAAIFGEALAD